MKRIAIIGAGIGGLTAALAFKRKGLNVIVYESAAEIKPVGAGIGIANNAMPPRWRKHLACAVRNKTAKRQAYRRSLKKSFSVTSYIVRDFLCL